MAFSPLDSALLGPLFATAAMSAAFSDEARLAAMLRAEAALARAEADAGLVPDALAEAIEEIEPASLDLDALGRETALAGVPVIPFVKAVQARLPADLEPAFHKGATTQDIQDTALVLQVQEALDLLSTDLAAILDGLTRLAATHRTAPCAGRTYGQHAAPVTFGFKVAGWALGIAEAAARLPAIRDAILCACHGGPVGTLAALGPAAREVALDFAAELGLRADPAAWHTRRLRIAETGAWLALLIGATAKMATDIASLSSTEIGEVAEPVVKGRGGSSAMPHKRNPVSSTVILAAHLAAKGHVATLLDAMAAAHERPAGAWHAEWHALPQLFGLASGALREARSLAEGLVVEPERMAEVLEMTGGLLFADAAAACLAPLVGGRAAAHALVERAAAEVRRTGASLAAVLAAAPECRGASDALAGAFDLAPAIAAGAAATDRALAEVDLLRRVADL